MNKYDKGFSDYYVTKTHKSSDTIYMIVYALLFGIPTIILAKNIIWNYFNF